MHRLNAHFLYWVGLTVLVVTLWLIPFSGATEAAPRTFQVDARQFEFTPGRIEVNQGDVVTLTLTASDAVHGFYLDGYGVERSMTPGISKQITLTADQPGKFRYRCSVSCGTLHPFMIGELVVNANQPLWRALATLSVSIGGILLYLWHFGGKAS